MTKREFRFYLVFYMVILALILFFSFVPKSQAVSREIWIAFSPIEKTIWSEAYLQAFEDGLEMGFYMAADEAQADIYYQMLQDIKKHSEITSWTPHLLYTGIDYYYNHSGHLDGASSEQVADIILRKIVHNGLQDLAEERGIE